MYEIVMIITACALAIPALFYLVPRIVSCYSAFASATPFDDLDESCLLDGWNKTGNHPAGVLADVCVCAAAIFISSLAWPASIPAGTVIGLAWRQRRQAIVIQKLKGTVCD